MLKITEGVGRMPEPDPDETPTITVPASATARAPEPAESPRPSNGSSAYVAPARPSSPEPLAADDQTARPAPSAPPQPPPAPVRTAPPARPAPTPAGPPVSRVTAAAGSRWMIIHPHVSFFEWLADKQGPAGAAPEERLDRYRRESPWLFRTCVVLDLLVLFVVTGILVAALAAVLFKAIWGVV